MKRVSFQLLQCVIFTWFLLPIFARAEGGAAGLDRFTDQPLLVSGEVHYAQEGGASTYLALNGQHIVITKSGESYFSGLPHRVELFPLGLSCITEDDPQKECRQQLPISSLYTRFWNWIHAPLSQMIQNNPQSKNILEIPQKLGALFVKTKIISISDTSLVLKLEIADEGATAPLIWAQYQLDVDGLRKLSAQVVPFQALNSLTTERRTIKYNEAWAMHYEGTHMIISPKTGQPGQVSTGTGFFINDSGLMVTNHHVLATQLDCMKKLKCRLQLATPGKEKLRLMYEGEVQLLKAHPSLDFALLQIKNYRPKHFYKINTGTIPQNVATVGFPCDLSENKHMVLSLGYNISVTPMSGATIGEAKAQGPLRLNIMTNMDSAQGASGSPVFNARTNEVYGILFASAFATDKGQGCTGGKMVYRPMQEIEETYGISDYVSGQVQARVNQIVASLKTETTVSSYIHLLQQWRDQKTLYRLADLKSIYDKQKNPELKKAIESFLKNQGKLEVLSK